MRSTSAFHGLRYFRNFPILIPLYRRSFPTLFHSPRLSPNYTENFHASSRLIARSRLFKRRRREDRIDLTLFICLYSRGTACARNLGYHKRSENLKICIYRLLLVFIIIIPCSMRYLQIELYRDIQELIIQSFQWHPFPNLLKIMNTCEFHCESSSSYGQEEKNPVAGF